MKMGGPWSSVNLRTAKPRIWPGEVPPPRISSSTARRARCMRSAGFPPSWRKGCTSDMSLVAIDFGRKFLLAVGFGTRSMHRQRSLAAAGLDWSLRLWATAAPMAGRWRYVVVRSLHENSSSKLLTADFKDSYSIFWHRATEAQLHGLEERLTSASAIWR